jgi:hypothetical protein
MGLVKAQHRRYGTIGITTFKKFSPDTPFFLGVINVP